jgi:hypothetical protein
MDEFANGQLWYTFSVMFVFFSLCTDSPLVSKHLLQCVPEHSSACRMSQWIRASYAVKRLCSGPWYKGCSLLLFPSATSCCTKTVLSRLVLFSRLKAVPFWVKLMSLSCAMAHAVGHWPVTAESHCKLQYGCRKQQDIRLWKYVPHHLKTRERCTWLISLVSAYAYGWLNWIPVDVATT